MRHKLATCSVGFIAAIWFSILSTKDARTEELISTPAMQKWVGEGCGLASWSGDQVPFKDQDKVIFFGDSITSSGTSGNGYIKLLDRALKKSQPDLKVLLVNSGNSGNKVPHLQTRLHSDVLSKKPTILFIYIGINDVWHDTAWDGSGTPAYAFKAGLRHIIEKSQDRGAAIVIATPSVIGEKTDGTNELDQRLDEYAQISRDLAKEMKVTLCDLRASFKDYLKEHNPQNAEKGLLTVDRVHLNDLGNELVAHKAAEAISAALNRKQK
jgi:lysophospholipase L1-like esterase